jgi:predicted  nucleic acid-binding Zn-ribbon protein
MTDERGVTKADLDLIDAAIANHEACQGQLYQFRMILGQVGKVDARRADIVRGVEAEQARLTEAQRAANAAQANLDGLRREIDEKRRELAEVEKKIAEAEVRLNELTDARARLLAMLAAA